VSTVEDRSRPPTATILLPDHPTAVVFLDETGVVHRQNRDKFFGIGCLKCRNPGPLLQGVHNLRERAGFRDELHWSDFDKARLRHRPDIVDLAKAIIDLVFDSDDAFFCCWIANRDHGDLTARFANHRHPGHKAYEWLAAEVLHDTVDEHEVITVLADRLSTTPEVLFESDVARVVNLRRQRLAISNVCRLDSRSTDGLQVVDLLLGAATLDLRQGRTGAETQKQALLTHLLDRCDCASFRPNGRSRDGKFKVELLAKPRKTRRGGR
jgi:uncharacterized protein DUF3800